MMKDDGGAGFDPSRWITSKHSPNLNKWLARNARPPFGFPTVFLDRDGVRWIGWIDDVQWFVGCRLMRCLGDGAKAEAGAFASLASELVEDWGFWDRYKAIGRCAIDERHAIAFIGEETRWDVTGDVRECRWCGSARQERKHWTETVERSRWVPCNSDGTPQENAATRKAQS